MVDIGTKIDLAKWLNGGSAANTSSQSTTQVTGTVMTDSSNGTVEVMIGEPDGSTTAADLTATIPIIGSASAGDEVVVIVQDATPVAIAAPGWGDDINDKTQYITFVSSGADAGLHIHENASSYNTDGDLHLDSGGVEIRDSGTVLATFSDSAIELGKNSPNAVISLLDGHGQIRATGAGLLSVLYIEASSLGVLADNISRFGSPGGSDSSSNFPLAEVYAGQFKTAKIALNGQYIDDGSTPVASTIKFSADRLIVDGADLSIGNNNPGTSGQVLTSQGAGQPPIWAAGGGGSGASSTTATIATADWSSQTATVSVTGVTSSNIVIVSPDPTCASDWAAAGVLCTAQGSGTLTFTCSTTPTASLTANVVVM